MNSDQPDNLAEKRERLRRFQQRVRMIVVIDVIGFVLILILPEMLQMIVGTAILLFAIVSLIYVFIEYRRITRRG